MKIPAHFPKWNKAVDGLEDAAKWAMDMERLRLPPGVDLLRQGQVWETVCNCEVSFRASMPPPWKAPKAGLAMSIVPSIADVELFLSGFGTANLPCGEWVQIVECEPRPLWVNFRPLRYEELHHSIVPEKVRARPGYSGYTLTLKSARTISELCVVRQPAETFFNEVFHLVQDAG